MIYNLGRVVPIFKGDYDGTATYSFLDVVFYDNSSFVALDTTTGNLPTDTSHWLPVALKGLTQNPTQAQMQQIISEVETYMHSTDFVYDADYTHIDVIDNHTSTSTTNALSANQGKVLYDLIDDVNHEVDDLTNDVNELNTDIHGGNSIIGTKTNPPVWSGKYVDSSGNLITGTNQYKLTNPIHLNIGESLNVVQTYSPTYGSIFLTDENLTYATRVVNNLTNATYTATSECYVSANINTSSTTYTITKTNIGIEQNIGDLSDLQTTNKTSLVNAINEVKNATPSTDSEPTQGSTNPISSNGVYEALHGQTYTPEYTLLEGNRNIDNTEWVGTGQYKHTTAIPVNEGDTVVVYNQYGTKARMLWKSDSGGNPTQNLSAYQNSGTLIYVATENCYVVADFNTGGNYYIKITPKGLVEIVDDNTDAIDALNSDVLELQNECLDKTNTLVLGTDYSWIAGSYTNHSITSAYRTSPIHLNAGDTIIQELRYSSPNNPSIAAVPNDSENTSYNTSVITELSERFDKDGNSWYRKTFTAKYDMYVVCSSQSNGSTTNTIKIVSGTLHNLENKTLFEQEKKKALNYLPDEYAAIKTDIDSRYTIQSNSLFRNAMKERQIMISQIAQMDKEDADNVGVSGYVSHVLTEGKCGYYIDGSNNFTDDTIHWKLYDNGILFISGYGKMYDFVKGVSCCMTKAQLDANYPLSGNMWYYNIPLNDVEYTYEGEGSVIYHNKRFFEQSFGDSTNPLNNKPYGYAAPWYIYRAETDMVNYTSESNYYAKNPQKWSYNRICIVEDTSNFEGTNVSKGGITYIGNWNFYRNTSEYLLLPNHVEKIGAWGVRYSTTMKYLYMGDLITEIEDHGVSRNEALEHIRFSSSLNKVWLNGIQTNPCLYNVRLRHALNDVDNSIFYSNGSTVYIDLNGTKTIPSSCFNGIVGSSHLLFANIGEGCETISSYAFATNSNLIELTIPSTLTSIGNQAFSYCTNLKYLTIDSSAIAAPTLSVGTMNGNVFANVQVLRIKNTISSTGGIEAYFSYVGEKDGYKYYVRMK